MLEKIENLLRDLMSALQIARLYPAWHPEFKKGIDKAYLSLQDVLKTRPSLVVGIVGQELAFEKEIFFDLSKTLKPMIIYLKDRGIERIEFLSGLTHEELSKFISLLVAPKEEIKAEPQKALSLSGVRNIIVAKITTGISVASGKPSGYLRNYEESLEKISSSLENVLNEEDIDYLSLRFDVTNFMDNLMNRYQEFLNFATMKRYDLKTFSHILNVSILSMYFASKIGFNKEQVVNIGTAALFHDIGKLYISRGLLKKPYKLTEGEYSQIKSHVIIGAEILLKYVETLGILPVVVCFEHHLRYDLKGYPKVSFYRKLNIASLIVSICDVYDALSQRRNYKSDYPPPMIYELMVQEKGRAFQPQLIDKFFRIMGVWPIGTIVALKDERIAVVREENEEDIFSPKVEVIAPAERREIIDLKAADEQGKIQRALNPFNEGKEYLGLI